MSSVALQGASESLKVFKQKEAHFFLPRFIRANLPAGPFAQSVCLARPLTDLISISLL